MFDKWTTKWSEKALAPFASFLRARKVSPDFITLVGFLLGLGAIIWISLGEFYLGLIFILLNRVCDGLDGILARMDSPTDRGGFLDITLDFIFYSGVVLGFGIYDIASNGIAALILMFSFVGTGTSFLAFSIMAERRKIQSTAYSQKGIYYLIGIAEGTETIMFFVAICLLPTYFNLLAYGFAFICYLTTFLRIIMGYKKFS